ncbi:MAG TPA: hypothetical protein VFT56_11070 [Sphingomonas sp.]|nr:hypothetical protein [Sphingomonas sp.]
MSLLDDMTREVSGVDLTTLADRLGLTPAQAESALAALGRAEPEPGDTADLAAAKAGLPRDQVARLLEAIGGEDGLRRIVGALSQGGGIASVTSGLFAKD